MHHRDCVSPKGSAPSRLLFIADDVCFPTNSGGRAELFGELSALKSSNRYDVRALIFGRKRLDNDSARQLDDLLGVGRWSYIQRRSFLNATARHPQLPYQTASRRMPRAALRWLKREMGGEPFTTIASHEWTLLAVRQLYKHGLASPVILRSHNDEVRFLRSLQRSPTTAVQRKLYLGLEIARFTKTRESLYRYVDRVALISAEDAAAYPHTDNRVVPPVLFTESLSRTSRQADKLGSGVIFVGALDMHHAAEGLLWFLEQVWPAIALEEPSTRMTVIGRNPTVKVRNAITKHDVTLLRNVPDITPELKAARLFVNPVFSGSGVNMKMGPPAALGVPIVTTSFGIRGLALMRGALVADTPSGFARHVLDLLQQDDLCRHVAEAQRVGSSGYSKDAFVDAIDRLIEEFSA